MTSESRRRGPRTSIRRRITVTTVVVSILAILATSGLAIVAARIYLGQRTASNLDLRVHRVRALVDDVDHRTIPLSRVEDLLSTDDAAENGNGFVFVTDRHAVASFGVTAADARQLAAIRRPLAASAVGGVQSVEASSLTLASGALTLQTDDGDVGVDRIIVTADTRQRDDSVRLIFLANALGSALGIALVIALVTTTIGRGLRPLQDMADRAEAVADGDHTARLPLDVRDPAIERLSWTVNAAFDAQQDAENRMREFVADAGHELRTPLTVATGWLDLYAQGGLADAKQLEDALARVRAQLGRMRAMADELALLAGTDEGRVFADEPVDLVPLVHEVVQDARFAFPERSIAWEAPEHVMVTGDAPRLAQVFRNLIGNAVQHTGAESLIAVRVASAPDGDGGIVDVEDHGEGIEEQDLPHVFERFWRSDTARQRVTGGSGLGLAITQSVVAAHGGSITVRSQRGHGTTFRVRLR